MTPLFESIDDLILHRAPMLLVESVISWSDDSVVVSVNPNDSRLFANEDGFIPAWVGIEYMAQAISAFAGIGSKLQGDAVGIGFLLGTRKYSANVAGFAPHQRLQVHVHQLLRDENNLVLFACEIYADNQCVASAEIKAIQPKNIDKLLFQVT